jgi:NADPH:quinone reductase
MTRAIRFYDHGGPEVLRLEEIQLPPLQPNELRIAVRAIGLNRAESMFRRGAYVEKAQLPARLGYEAAGTVEEIGRDVRDFEVGDAVSLIPPSSISKWGTYAEKANIPAEFAVKHPPEISWEDAASIWMSSATAYGALIDIAGLRKGDVVVINAASSSVGVTAIQMANAVGATPIALTRSASKRERLLSCGAAHVIATGEEDLVSRVMEISDGRGARVIFDAVGGANFEKITKIAANHGIIVLYGRLEQTPTSLSLFDTISKSLTIRGFLYKEFVSQAAARKSLKEFVLESLRTRKLSPRIDRVFPFEKIVEATRYLESNEQFGKIVITV